MQGAKSTVAILIVLIALLAGGAYWYVEGRYGAWYSDLNNGSYMTVKMGGADIFSDTLKLSGCQVKRAESGQSGDIDFRCPEGTDINGLLEKYEL